VMVGCTKSVDVDSAPTSDSATQTASIGHGEEIVIEEHLVRGKTTVVDFYSDYCGACVLLSPELEALAADRGDIALVKVNVNRPDVRGQIDWDSPVARQHGLESLPHLVIFDESGKEEARGDEALEMVFGWLDR